MILYTTKSDVDKLTYEIIGAAIRVHKYLGPGLLESVYHECMKIELEDRGILFDTELKVPIEFNERLLETTLRCDLFIENILVVELKSVKELTPVHHAQLLTYMKLLRAPKGLLINFNCSNLFYEGQKTMVSDYYKRLID